MEKLAATPQAASTPTTSSAATGPASENASTKPWYAEVTAYQWLVLAIASAGWVFDVFEGQIFNITRTPLLAEVLKVPPTDPAIKFWGDVLLAVFLVGGAAGGIVFGSLADRWGRGISMILTILMYTIFSGLTYFATELWQVAVLRGLVAAGVGGEWAVAAALVAEVMPQRARSYASGIFHASSVLGTWMAAAVGMLVGTNWRYAYLVGIAPALLVLIVRAFIREPQRWQNADDKSMRRGSLVDLWRNRELRRRAILGLLLAAVGLGGFWGVMVASQNLAENMQLASGVLPMMAAQNAKFAYGIVATAGGGIGLLAMGPMCARLGRRRAFIVFLVGALILTPVTCFAPRSYNQLLLLLPIFGFFNLGMHAGFAVYFPELFPTAVRATGAGLCFNGGRVLAASILVLAGSIKAMPGMDLRWAMTILSLVYVPGIAVVMMLPETRGQGLRD